MLRLTLDVYTDYRTYVQSIYALFMSVLIVNFTKYNKKLVNDKPAAEKDLDERFFLNKGTKQTGSC